MDLGYIAAFFFFTLFVLFLGIMIGGFVTDERRGLNENQSRRMAPAYIDAKAQAFEVKNKRKSS
ncbi:hypothetical protein V7122_02350 [Bacillus sp. JJ1532]|uniref:hypothetical protein n=1 Tax=Bacillus sp. JJ1532 TaxID=3122958 RepID=UPI002FFF7D9A